MSLALGIIVFLLGPVISEGPPAPPGPATASILRLAEDKALKGLELGANVRCTTDRASWGGHRQRVRMNPASGAKLLTTAAALAVLTPEHTFATRLNGRVDLAGTATEVVLVAGADPSLTIDDLERLAASLHDKGVRRIDGGILFDISVFAGSSTPPAYDTKKSDAGYRPQVPAFAVGSGAFVATVTPGEKAGDPVRVTTSVLANALDVDNSATTVAGKAIDKLVVEARAGADGKTRLVVSGSLGKDAPPQGTKKRFADPSRIAADLFVRALEKKGITVAGGERFFPDEAAPDAAKPGTAPELAQLVSDPLAADVKETNTTSNNFMAETIFKHLGVAPDGPATWERAARRTSEALRTLGVDPGGFEIINGSGLYDGTKVSAEAMTTLLALESADSPAARSFVESLAIAGTSGTLKGRLVKLKGKVSGKTGTLDNATSLSGYVKGKTCLLAFSVLVNGEVGARAPAVNKRIDAFVTELSGL